MRMQLPHRVHYPETCAYGPLGIIVMGLGIAKIDDDLLPPILSNIAIKLPDDAGTCLLVGMEHGVEVVRGQGPGTWVSDHEGAHQDGQLPPFGVGRSGEGREGRILSGRLVREVRVPRGSQGMPLLSSVWHRWRGWRFERRCHALVRRSGRRPCLHWHDEAIPRPIDGLDEPLAAPTIPNRLAHGLDRTLERRIADELLRPDLLTQLLLGDDPVGMRQQIGQDLERFAPQPADASGAGQLIALCVEGPLAEDVDHVGILRE
jgi:hypothetical protein